MKKAIRKAFMEGQEARRLKLSLEQAFARELGCDTIEEVDEIVARNLAKPKK